MAITAYTGLMGAGKSYEVVANVILPALDKGRRVITNLEGLNYERITEFLLSRRSPRDRQLPVGELVLVGEHDLKSPDLFPKDGNDFSATVRPGDLIVIDEAWQTHGAESSLQPNHFQFFRMHRHWVNPTTKQASDIVFIIQDLEGLNKNIRRVIFQNYRMEKKLSLGLEKVYSVNQYNGAKQFKTNHAARFRRMYDPKIFALYQSYTGGEGKEVATDKRQNIFNNPLLKLAIVGVPLLVIALIFLFIHLWNTGFGPKKVPEVKPAENTLPVSANSAEKNTPEVKVFSSGQPVKPSLVSASWRIIGYMTSGDMVILKSPEGILRYERSVNFLWRDGDPVEGDIDGQKVTRYSGQPSAAAPGFNMGLGR